MSKIEGLHPSDEQPIVGDVWSDKYKYEDEADLDATMSRTIIALTENETKSFRNQAIKCAHRREIIPAGRVLAGAGTDKRVTLINCFVLGLIQDSMNTIDNKPGKGIMASCADAAFTQQMGGGIGQDFSPIRPRGADVGGHTVSSGIIPFMMMWDSMCATIRSAGARRGAMMGVLSCSHPDILEFIETKQTPGQLTNFNVSILVTDKFMHAVENDLDWDLSFTVARADGEHVQWGLVRPEEAGPKQNYYVYKRLKARELWDKIIGGTYIYAEPGIIFIDRVNKQNNLNYCEDIQCTNPCGEQPLPPHGDCCLGHVNLAVLVNRAFTKGAKFSESRFRRAVRIMVRLLDNVLDVTRYPLPEQAQEAKDKRRIGLGYTGLASALQQLRIAYGSEEAIAFTGLVTQLMAEEAYAASVQLAKERGPFPLYDQEEILNSPFVNKLAETTQVLIRKHGLRNGVLMSIAPTGTTSLVLGNVSSGIEPVFAHKYVRKMRAEDGQLSREYSVYDYGYLLYCQKHNLNPDDPGNCADIALPDYFVTADDLTVEQHLLMAAAAQEWIDAALSKTINCPTSMEFDDFKKVYSYAYMLGMKGCTTYRPDPRSGRGAILTTEPEKVEETIPAATPATKVHRPTVVEGRTYKIKWPQEDCAYYVTINDYVNDDGDRRPLEIFISTKSARHDEWVKALCLMITAIFRRAGNPTFIVEELKQVFSPTGGAWEGPAGEKKQYLPSLVAAISNRIEEHFVWLGMIEGSIDDDPGLPPEVETTEQLDVCVKCGARAVIYTEGCATCRACGHSDCG